MPVVGQLPRRGPFRDELPPQADVIGVYPVGVIQPGRPHARGQHRPDAALVHVRLDPPREVGHELVPAGLVGEEGQPRPPPGMPQQLDEEGIGNRLPIAGPRHLGHLGRVAADLGPPQAPGGG